MDKYITDREQIKRINNMSAFDQNMYIFLRRYAYRIGVARKLVEGRVHPLSYVMYYFTVMFKSFMCWVTLFSFLTAESEALSFLFIFKLSAELGFISALLQCVVFYVIAVVASVKEK